MKIEDKVHNKSFKQFLEYSRSDVKNARRTFETQWGRIASFMSPRRVRFSMNDQDKGDARWHNIINNVATKSTRIAVAGMFAGNMSPARPWFALVHPDEDMMEFEPVRIWLHQVEQKILAVFRDSNFYNIAPLALKDLILFGTSSLTHVDNFENVAKFYSHPLGSYWLGLNDELEVVQHFREFQLNVDQVIAKYGMENVSVSVKNAYNQGDYKTKVGIANIIMPNPLIEPNNPFARGKPYVSVSYEIGIGGSQGSGGGRGDRGYEYKAKDDEFLGFDGFFEQPFYSPRWEVAGEDTYATECPGMIALGDTKQLQSEERQKGQAIQKQVSPPLQAPASLSNTPINSLPGGVTHYEQGAGNGNSKGTIQTLYEVQLNLQEMREDMLGVEARIKDAFFVNMFLAITEMEGVQPRNEYELINRNDEKLLQLGPVLQQIQGEMLSKVIDRVFAQLIRADDNGKNGVLPQNTGTA